MSARVESHMRQAVDRGARQEQEWKQKYEAYRKAFPELAAEWETLQRGRLPEGWDSKIPVFPADLKGTATRESAAR